MTAHIDRAIKNKRIAIIGAGAAGLMAADVLSAYQADVHVYERMPSAGRKILMAGKTGLNLSNTRPLDEFVNAYTPAKWVAPMVRRFDAKWLTDWLDALGVPTYVGSTGRIFPVAMKAAPFLRAWLVRLQAQGVTLHYRHRLVKITDHTLSFQQGDAFLTADFDAVILACGGASYARLGSDGAWTTWLAERLGKDSIVPFAASNVGTCRMWSPFMQVHFGQALKRVRVSVLDTTVMGDVMLSHYGLEGGVIYQLNRALKQMSHAQNMALQVDLLPDVRLETIIAKLNKNKKHSLANRLRKLGLDAVKTSLLFECAPKTDWQQPEKLAKHIKSLHISLTGFRPLDEAISTTGGLALNEVNARLQLKRAPHVFAAGEMLDWDAPTGGYLLNACFAMGRVAALGVVDFLSLSEKPSL